MKYAVKTLAAGAFSVLLASCGGGGGGGGLTVSTAAFPLRAIYKSSFLDATNSNFTLSGSLTISGASAGIVSVSGSGSNSYAPVAPAVFEGKSGFQRTLTQSATMTLTGSGGSVPVPVSAIQTTYVDANYLLTGYTSASTYVVPDGAVAIPETAKVGDSGVVANLSAYTSSAKTTKSSTSTMSWALKPDTATTAIAELTQVIFNAGVPNSTILQRYRITAAGGQTRIDAVETYSGLSLGSGLFATGSVTYSY